MKALIRFMLLVLSVVEISLQAAEPIGDQAIVKVKSRFCDPDQGDGMLAGSGILFRSGSGVFVLTSEHVVLHARAHVNTRANTEDLLVCHSVMNTSLREERPAKLRAADWSTGLALLEISGGGLSGLSIPDISVFGDFSSLSVHTFGFPHESASMVQDPSGRILTMNGQRHRIPGVSSTMEIAAHGEYGMSGGAVLDSSRSSVIGILSHQFLSLKRGDRSELKQFQAEGSDVDILIAIPATQARSWIEGVLNGTIKPKIVRDPAEQLVGGQSVLYSGVLLASMGGGDGVGIGGVSGNSAQSSGPSHATFYIANSKVIPDCDESALEKSQAQQCKWIMRIRSELLRRNTVTIPFFVAHEGGLRMKRVEYNSLEEFFVNLGDPSLSPVLGIQSSEFGPKYASSTSVAAVKIGQGLRSTLNGLAGQTPAKVAALLDEISVVSDLLISGNADLIHPQRLSELANGTSSAWESLFNQNFEQTVEMLQLLKQVER